MRKWIEPKDKCWICGGNIPLLSYRYTYCSDKCRENKQRAYSIGGKFAGIEDKKLSKVGRPKLYSKSYA